MTFDPLAICDILNKEGVRYVVLGGFAALVHGSPLPTQDIDLIPATSRYNLVRLASALRRLEAQLRTRDEPVPALLDERFLRDAPPILNLVTRFGDLDLTFKPAGPLSDYEGWRQRSRATEVRDGLVIDVASLDDVIASKRAANRPKDASAVPMLEALRDQLDGA